MAIESVNPSTGEVLRIYQESTDAEIDRAISTAHVAHLEWKETDLSLRSGLLLSAAQILRDRRDEYATLMAREMGKAIREGRGEVEKCAWVCEHYAEFGARYLDDEEVPTEASRSYVTFEPLGVILAVMPWNFPFWQVFRFAAPGLFAGNAGLLKHASNVFGCALAIEGIFRDASFPEGLFRSLLIGSPRVEAVIQNPRVAAVSLTGSTPAGRAVAATAGAALKKTVLELGGSDAYVILEDADLEKAATQCVIGRLINVGQSCIAAKRLIVPRRILHDFQELVVKGMESAVVGDPLSEETTQGPMARYDLREELHRQVRESVEKGARCLLGGEIPQGPGAFYPPTVLTDVGCDMPAYSEELFGPVAAIIPVANDEEAVLTANDSAFGLGAAVFTSDTIRGELIAARRLQAGCCFVNAFVRSDPRLPFGGIKESGYGRELSSFGIREFVNVKTVYVE